MNPTDVEGTFFAVVATLLVAALPLYIVAYFLVAWLVTPHGRQRLRASIHGFALKVRDGAGMVLFFGIFAVIAFAVIQDFAPNLVSRSKMFALALAGFAGYLACCGLVEFWRAMEGFTARGGSVTQTIERGRHVGTQAEAQRAVDRQARLQGQRGNLGRPESAFPLRGVVVTPAGVMNRVEVRYECLHCSRGGPASRCFGQGPLEPTSEVDSSSPY